ncbi:TPA: energy transducer TonB [Candidatus Marinimicrobia bacterium]|nr:MAG: TonB-like protein [Marinimicrobia bacterium 46_47]KUK91633.1 MAG: TonB-like protein [Marinimicrobia bacterium 46_43]HAE87791.1 energy transducer TonB [Candidatus Neomarinimicrobiota bacterium]HBY18606.1 energy transducer TonB [Candidatus Neomarinimicrobiota bacterium]
MSVKQFERFKERSTFIAEVSSTLVVFLLILVFYFAPKFESNSTIESTGPQIQIEVMDIPPTQQIQQSAPPQRPTVPVMSEDEEIAEDITMEELDFEDFELMDAPPPPPEENDEESGPRVRFIPYDEPPEPIGGANAILRNIVYPEIAREAQIEGTVIVQAFVNEKGVVTDCVIMKGIPNTGLDEAAIEAIKKTRFKPAKQRDRNVGVWIAIPVVFKLK